MDEDNSHPQLQPAVAREAKSRSSSCSSQDSFTSCPDSFQALYDDQFTSVTSTTQELQDQKIASQSTSQTPPSILPTSSSTNMDQDLREDKDQLLVRLREMEIDKAKVKEENDTLKIDSSQVKAKMESTDRARIPRTGFIGDRNGVRLNEAREVNYSMYTIMASMAV